MMCDVHLCMESVACLYLVAPEFGGGGGLRHGSTCA